MAEQPERLPLPLTAGELAMIVAVIELVTTTASDKARLASRGQDTEMLPALLDRLRAFEEYMQARRRAAQLGLLLEAETPPATR